ncbi:hypothetical protein [Enterovibrio norvegicus]|uniref:hypothetical protein n=1 Tax=Enterovibrio norvegicus TaxID=188144 RepID=UPI000C84EE40|nr:hypothetical protein [Enterovibrio norvegicus]PML77165.1 hypothetical protein BCT69_20880 [Enterovibrio norvegicus]
MKQLKALLTECKKKARHGGKCAIFTEVESAYKNHHKIPHYSFNTSDTLSANIGIQIADIYDSAESLPQNVLVTAAYQKMIDEVMAQFEFLQQSKMALTVEPYFFSGEPYASSSEMLLDLLNFHMYFLPTQSAFGESTPHEHHPMLERTGVTVGDYELLVNDVFRIVHDIFGHASYGYSFGPLGEDMAWLVHSRMFSPLARAAITTETRGQNSWVNWGPHMRNRDNQLITENDSAWLAPDQRPFAEQKTFLMPDYVSGVKVYLDDEQHVCAEEIIGWDPYISFCEPKKESRHVAV